MVQPSINQLRKTETDVAVLQVQYTNLVDKVDDVKSDLKDMREHIDASTELTHSLMKEYQEETIKTYQILTDKVTTLEKWKWMIMGAGIALGSLGFEIVSKLLSIGV